MTSSPAVPAITLADAPNHINPDLYIDRELSWIAFNQRVLEEVQDTRNPLLERVNFLSIFSANLDEFFMIRVSGVKKQILAGVTQRAPSGLTPLEQFGAVRAALLPQLAERQRLFQEELLPALHATGIHLLSYADLTPSQNEALPPLLRARGLPGADATGYRRQPSLPLHLEPEYQPAGRHR